MTLPMTQHIYTVEFWDDFFKFKARSFGTECPRPNLSFCLAICLNGLRKTTKIIIIKSNQCPGRNSKSFFPEYTLETLPHEPAPSDIFKQSFRLTLANTTQRHITEGLDPQEQSHTDIGTQLRKWLQSLAGLNTVGSGHRVTYSRTPCHGSGG
jgi:hypothetical protein